MANTTSEPAVTKSDAVRKTLKANPKSTMKEIRTAIAGATDGCCVDVDDLQVSAYKIGLPVGILGELWGHFGGILWGHWRQGTIHSLLQIRPFGPWSQSCLWRSATVLRVADRGAGGKHYL